MMTINGARGRRGWGRLLVASATVALLAGCSEPLATPGWTPPAWEGASSVRLVAADARTGPALDDLGFVERRVRNDAAGYQARYVEIPGATEFNKAVDAIIRAPLAGAPLEPEAFPSGSGLADRGCVPGSAGWEADRLLTDSATGPANGSGAAVTCEIVAAFGSTVGVAMRTVTGSNGTAATDQTITFYADLKTGTVIDSADRWTPQAASELWTRGVEQLRRAAGGLSGAPIAPPSEEQTALAAQSFGYVRERADGTATITLPAGIASPELAGLGVERTSEPTTVVVDAELLASWQSEAAGSLRSQQGVPFTGLPAWDASLPVDCSLLTCIAITFDDGPSQSTPRLLETLRAEQSGATFFMQCKNVSSQPDVVKSVATEGQEIGSHTMTHTDLTQLSAEKASAEVNDCANKISALTGRPVTLYRPPFGAVNAKVLEAVGKPAILWSIDTNDWQRPGPDALIQRTVPVAKRGDIILFHDIHPDSVNTAGRIIEGLKDRGFTPVTVTQLFGDHVPRSVVRSR